MAIQLIDFGLDDRKALKTFVKFPYRIYRHDRNWIPRLNLEYLGNRLLGQVGMFQAEFPYHDHAKTRFFIAKENSEIVGRITASIDEDYEKFHKQRLGTFGFFECIDDNNIAQKLLHAAQSWCQNEGAQDFMGPFNFTSNHTCGLLIDGFDDPPMIEMTYNPPYYANLLTAFGLKKRKDLLSFKILSSRDNKRAERLERIGAKIQKRLNLSIRPFNVKRLKEETKIFVALYNDTWKENWGFVPVSEAEADHIAENLKIALDPRIFLFAEVEGEVVATIGSFPDLNWALRIRPGSRMNWDWLRLIMLLWRKRTISRGRTFVFGVREDFRKRGIESLLFQQSLKCGRKVGYRYGECGWILEDNEPMLRETIAMGGQPYKTYRIFGV